MTEFYLGGSPNSTQVTRVYTERGSLIGTALVNSGRILMANHANLDNSPDPQNLNGRPDNVVILEMARTTFTRSDVQHVDSVAAAKELEQSAKEAE
jgi:hypothetical protein